MQRKSQLRRTYCYAMNPLTQVLIQSLSLYNKSKGNKFSIYVNAKKFFLAHCACVFFFSRTVDLCRIIFTPSYFVRRRNGSTLSFLLENGV